MLRSQKPTCTNRLPTLKDCVRKATFLQCFVELAPEAANFRFFHKSYAKHHMGILWKKHSLNFIVTGNTVLNKILSSYDFLSFSLASLFNFCRTRSSCQVIWSLGVPPREDLVFCVYWHLGQFSVPVMELSSSVGKTELLTTFYCEVLDERWDFSEYLVFYRTSYTQ